MVTGLHPDAVTIVPYGGTLSRTEDGALTLGNDTKRRLKKAWEVARANEPYVIMLSAGFSSTISDQEKSMAEMMEAHARREHAFCAKIVVVSSSWKNVWGSCAETKAAIDFIRTNGLPRRAVVVSSWYHIPRLRILWRRMLGDEWCEWGVRFVHSSATGSPWMPVLEVVNLLGTLCGLETTPRRLRWHW